MKLLKVGKGLEQKIQLLLFDIPLNFPIVSWKFGFRSCDLFMASEPAPPSKPPATNTRYYGWVIVGICTATIFVVTGTKGSFGALFKDMQKDLGWDRDPSEPYSRTCKRTSVGIGGQLPGPQP
jgi:hypothetical protein